MFLGPKCSIIELLLRLFMDFTIVAALIHFMIIQSVGNRVGVTEPFLMRMAHGAPMRSSSRMRENMKALNGNYENRFGTTKTVLPDDQTVRVCKRLYVALILSRLVQVPLLSS